MTPRERLLAVLSGKMPDRVPVTVYEHSPFNDAWANHEPSYAPLIELERTHGDSFVRASIGLPSLMDDLNAVHGAEERHERDGIVRTTEIDTPKGKLRMISRRDPAMMTYWQIEPLIKSNQDIDRLLSMPPERPEADAEQLRELQERVGGQGVLCFELADAVGNVVRLFEFEDFVMRCYTDEGPILAMLDRAQEQVLQAARLICETVDNAAIRLVGPEVCCAPLMNPQVYFPKYVVERDKKVVQEIRAKGNFSILHCHGRLKDVLDMIAEIGADALEPIETLPISTADVTLEEVKKRLGDKICLMGSVQAFTLENGTAEDVRRQVRESIDVAADGGRFVLLPTSAPFMVPIAPHVLRNVEAMYLAAHEFGEYGV